MNRHWMIQIVDHKNTPKFVKKLKQNRGGGRPVGTKEFAIDVLTKKYPDLVESLKKGMSLSK